MTFNFVNDGSAIELTIVGHEIKIIRILDIYKVVAYTKDLLTFDERRIIFKTYHRGDFEISEEEESWMPLLEWLTCWASLGDNWFSKCYPKPFDSELHIVWERQLSLSE